MKKIIILFIVLLSFIFLNLGKWVDITEKPVKSDILVCLGGGKIERVIKSIELLKQGYIENQVFLLIGESWYNQPYIKKNYPDISIIIDEGPKNTKDEVLFIKRYMIENNYKSAMIVTDPPHSRRVQLLTSLIFLDGDEALRFHLVGSDVKWWNRYSYYENTRAIGFSFRETGKIIYNFIAYNIFGLNI